MTRVRKEIITLTIEDVSRIITEHYADGASSENTKIEFRLKDISDGEDRYSSYVFDGAVITISERTEG